MGCGSSIEGENTPVRLYEMYLEWDSPNIYILQVEKVNLGVGKGLTQHVEVWKTMSRYLL